MSSEPKLVRLRTFSGPGAQLTAGLAKNLLAAEGIPCVVPGEMMAETLPGVDLVQMLVREEDAENAAQILKSFLDTPLEDVDEPESSEE